MSAKEIAQSAIQALKKAGAEHAQVRVVLSEKRELNLEAGELSLFRTVFDAQVRMKILKGKRQGVLAINHTDSAALEASAKEIVELLESSPEDSAYAIAPAQSAQEFSHGQWEADLDGMHKCLEEYRATTQQELPQLMLEAGLDHTRQTEALLNTNGAAFQMQTANYNFFSLFTGKRDEKMSSMNYVTGQPKDMHTPLRELFGLKDAQRETIEQIDQKPFSGNFTGDLIFHPNCLIEFISSLLEKLSDRSLINGSSHFNGKMGQRVLSEKFSLFCKPVDTHFSRQDFVDGDGFAGKNFSLFEKGILKSWCLSQYGANKTGLTKAGGPIANLVLEPGQQSLEELIRNTPKGILIQRFSGNRPAEDGDFSGVAKNSYAIADGKIVGPINEVTVAGNLFSMFQQIKGISRETLHNGSRELPWLAAPGFKISGK